MNNKLIAKYDITDKLLNKEYIFGFRSDVKIVITVSNNEVVDSTPKTNKRYLVSSKGKSESFDKINNIIDEHINVPDIRKNDVEKNTSNLLSFL
jgi:hypothetical protein